MLEFHAYIPNHGDLALPIDILCNDALNGILELNSCRIDIALVSNNRTKSEVRDLYDNK